MNVCKHIIILYFSLNTSKVYHHVPWLYAHSKHMPESKHSDHKYLQSSRVFRAFSPCNSRLYSPGALYWCLKLRQG